LGNAGVQLEHLLVINPPDDKATLWASEQCLRSGVFAAVIAWVQRSTPQKQRRLQIAAETGSTVAMVYRPSIARGEHSPAALRIALEPNPMGLHAFDQPQGVAWPGMASAHTSAEALSLHDLAVATVMPTHS